MAHLSVRLSGDLERRLDSAVENGAYENRSEAIRDCLRHGLPKLSKYNDYTEY